jgi:hypothetical protein
MPTRHFTDIEPILLIAAAIAGVAIVYRSTHSIPVTLIAAALAGTVGVAAQARRRVYLYRGWYRGNDDD